MNILICEDSRASAGRSVNLVLGEILKDSNHDIRLFDARDKNDQEIRDEADGQRELLNFLGDWRPNGLVMDLRFHGVATYGLSLLDILDAHGWLARIAGIHKIVWSKFENDPEINYHQLLVDRYGFREDRILNRLTYSCDYVAGLFN